MIRMPVAAFSLLLVLGGCQSLTGKTDEPVLHAAPGALPAQWQAFGNEPFWSVRLQADGRLRWSDPEHPQGRVFAARAGQGDGQFLWSGELEGKPAQIRLSVQPCSDGMSDTTYPITVRWEWAGQILSGCARSLE